MSKEVVGFSNIGELFDGEFPDGEEISQLKTVNKYDVVSVISYMIGVDDSYLDSKFSDEYANKINELRKNQEASIIRYLCKLRTTLMLNFKKTDDEMRYNLANIDRLDYFNHDEIKKLQSWGLQVVQPNYRSDKYIDLFNKLIYERIDACKALFPDWLKFEYIKDIFVVPQYNKPDVMKAEFAKFQEHIQEYPFQIYIYWEPDGEAKNIINSDGIFLNTIYSQHDDYFHDSSKFHDATDFTKESIYDFISRSKRTIIVVDCENSDVYKLYGVLKNLNQDEIEKVERIILYDDYHTSCGWDWLEKFINIAVKHVEVERVTDRKSLVDIKMTAGVC